jgi:topoisomerase-4 subunit A
MLSSTRKGRGVLSVDAPARAVVWTPAQGDHVAIIGDNRKMLIFKRNEVPDMARGKGVRLQRYRDGGVSDAKVFKMSEGLSWKDAAGRQFNVPKAELRDWLGNRSDAGRLPPKGFPKNNKFG